MECSGALRDPVRHGERLIGLESKAVAIKSSKLTVAASTAAAKAFPHRGGGGYLGRSPLGASGSELVIDAGTAPTYCQ